MHEHLLLANPADLKHRFGFDGAPQQRRREDLASSQTDQERDRSYSVFDGDFQTVPLDLFTRRGMPTTESSSVTLNLPSPGLIWSG